MEKNIVRGLSRGAAGVFAFGGALFAIGFALHYFVTAPKGLLDQFVASPLAAVGLGIVGGIIWAQRRNMSPIARFGILGAVLLFVAVWVAYLLGRG